MSTTKMAIMPHDHYESACDFIRTKTGRAESIKSGELVEEIGAACDAAAYEANLDLCQIIDGSIKSFTVPDDVTNIRSHLFYGCHWLISVAIHNGVTYIGRDAFRFCTNLASVQIPAGVTSIYEYTFCGCTSLASVEIPVGVTSIGESAFSGCTSLASVEIPVGVTSIGEGAFFECTSLASVVISDSVVNMSKDAFWCCTGLEMISLGSGITKIEKFACEMYSLKAVALRSETVCVLRYSGEFDECYRFSGTVDATYNPNGARDGYFYVPRALVEQYMIATNWTLYADQFRALEDYTVDGTVTGALDPDKI